MTFVTILLLLTSIVLFTQVKRRGVWPLAAGSVAGLALLIVVVGLFRSDPPALAASDQAFFDDVQAAAHKLGERIREELLSAGTIILVANNSSSGIVGQMERHYIRGFERGLGRGLRVTIFDPQVHGRPGGYVWGSRPIIPPPMWEDIVAHHAQADAVVSFIGLPPIQRDSFLPVYVLSASNPLAEIEQWHQEGGRATVLARVFKPTEAGREASFAFVVEGNTP